MWPRLRTWLRNGIESTGHPDLTLAILSGAMAWFIVSCLKAIVA
jgi:hypothetical protein